MDTHIVVRSGWCSLEHDKTMLRYAADITGKAKPKVLCLNTASSSIIRRLEKAQAAVEAIGCESSTLDFFDSIRPDYKDYILSHDMIYVGGGNTRSMLALWKEYGVDKAIHDAWKRGVVLTGFSAGAICWFEQCLTDSLAGEPQAIKGLGFLKGSACPHYDVESERRPTYIKKVLNKEILPGYALNDFTIIHFKGGEFYKALTTEENIKPVSVSNEGVETQLDTEIIPYIKI